MFKKFLTSFPVLFGSLLILLALSFGVHFGEWLEAGLFSAFVVAIVIGTGTKFKQ